MVPNNGGGLMPSSIEACWLALIPVMTMMCRGTVDNLTSFNIPQPAVPLPEFVNFSRIYKTFLIKFDHQMKTH